jgi:hypothetical protein
METELTKEGTRNVPPVTRSTEANDEGTFEEEGSPDEEWTRPGRDPPTGLRISIIDYYYCENHLIP